ncbi:MAG TPA: penicillin acylase family protein, partial [Chitinophagaceae bacterium]|nr:penicillin acylase family protein [Chitinophagaceae bacterium]
MLLRKLLLGIFLFPSISFAQTFTSQEINSWKAIAKNITIIRDKWGIPHIYGKTDADAVFGLMYAQCEENFPRIERNYLEMMGRLSEIEGKTQVYSDLEMRLLYDADGAKADYQKSPEWFKKLLNAFAAGINFYLATHSDVKPLVLKKFEPWFPLMYTDGSIAPTQTGGLTPQDMRNLYAAKDLAYNYYSRPLLKEENISGSNGFAIAPSKSASKNALLYINPHVTFYFRSEVQMVSEEGLNTYGAVTWGQFFVYQGFNEFCGWMHTSSSADVADLFIEKTQKQGDEFQYEYDGKYFPAKSKPITIQYKDGDALKSEVFTTYSTIHGPVMGSRNGQWLSLREKNRSMESLMQSWLRTKAKGFDDFKKVMDMRINNSNNTVFADNKGNIAYWHGNFMPKRDPSLDYALPVYGSTSATDWKGIHLLDEIVHVYNPASGFIQNCNSTPYTASGESSPKEEDFPPYMAPDGENFRGINAARLLKPAKDLTLDKLISDIGYNHYLAGFETLLPPLFKAYDALDESDSTAQLVREAILMLKSWDRKSEANSIPTTIAIEWGQRMLQKTPPAKTYEAGTNLVATFDRAVASVSATEKLELLKA